MNKTDFLPRLESLRGVAALTVVGYHVYGQLSGGLLYGWFDGLALKAVSAISNGFGAVVTFFVLSGFVLARSLDGNSDPVRFFRHRVFRLFPAAMAVVALLTALHWKFGLIIGYEASFDPLDVLLNLLLIRSDINGVMWSLTVECVATPLILLSVWLLREQGARPLWILITVLARPVVVGPLRASAGRLRQPRPALCLCRRRAAAFSGRPDNIAGRSATGELRSHCRGGAVLVLRIATPKRPHHPAGMPQRIDIDCADCRAAGGAPVQAARFRSQSGFTGGFPTASICCIRSASCSHFVCWIR